MKDPGCHGSLYKRVTDYTDDKETDTFEPGCFDTSEVDHLENKEKYLAGERCFIPEEIEVFQVITTSGDTGIVGEEYAYWND